MPSIIPKYEYDIFISYRQNDNLPTGQAGQSGWVTKFVDDLNREIKATFKDEISIYFDVNPHDGLHEHHDVDDSLKKKLKCLIFIPIVSRTYCDLNSFAWTNEFKIFLDQAREEELGLKVSVSGGNVSSRVLPVRIHELQTEDVALFEKETGSVMRSIDFIYKETGVNRPLEASDDRKSNSANLDYKNQINKVANAIDDIITHIKAETAGEESYPGEEKSETIERKFRFIDHLRERNVIRAGIMYILVALLVWKIIDILAIKLGWSGGIVENVILVLIILFPIATSMAWLFEWSPKGLVRIGSESASDNPYSRFRKKPLTSNAYMGILLLTFIALLVIFPVTSSSKSDLNASQSSVAVLPFVNNTGDPNLDFYGMGMASEIRTQFAVAKQFDFISSMQATIGFKNSTENPQTIGKKLRVTHILTGMYQGTENHLQGVVELVDAASGKIIWSLPFKNSVADFYKLQASVAKDVVRRFNGKDITTAISTTNLQAFEELSLGREIQYGSGDPAEELPAQEHYQKAIQLDSAFLQPWAALIELYCFYHFVYPQDTLISRHRIDELVNYVSVHFEDSWEKKEIMGVYTYQIKLEYEEAKQLFLEVLAENSDAETSNDGISAIYKREFDTKNALIHRLRFLKLNSEDQSSWHELGTILRNSGDYQNAYLAFKNEPYFQFLLKYNENALDDLDDQVKVSLGNLYHCSDYFLKRNYRGLLQFIKGIKPDSTLSLHGIEMFRIVAYYGLKKDDSVRIIASKIGSPSSNTPFIRTPFYDLRSWFLKSSILAGKSRLSEYISQDDKRFTQDAMARCYYEIREIQVAVLLSNYEDATRRLVKVNQEFPTFGDYVWLNHPEFDRIKEAYPPFVEAIKNIKLPPKVDIEGLKRQG